MTSYSFVFSEQRLSFFFSRSLLFGDGEDIEKEEDEDDGAEDDDNDDDDAFFGVVIRRSNNCGIEGEAAEIIICFNGDILRLVALGEAEGQVMGN